MSGRNCRSIGVGDAIAAPVSVARGGTVLIRSREAAEVARWFGLEGANTEERSAPRRRRKRLIDRIGEFELRPGTITLITGPSGSGKSSLLRALRSRYARNEDCSWIDLESVRVANVPVVNCFGNQPVLKTLELLGRVGLGEAWSYLRTPRELSEGQRFRLRLAVGLWRAGKIGDGADTGERRGATVRSIPPGGTVIVCDEFAAVLDRLTAMIVARCLRRAIDAHSNIAAVVATSHEDLIAALKPEVVVRCDFGRVQIEMA